MALYGTPAQNAPYLHIDLPKVNVNLQRVAFLLCIPCAPSSYLSGSLQPHQVDVGTAT
jgi:hypothetical protein